MRIRFGNRRPWLSLAIALLVAMGPFRTSAFAAEQQRTEAYYNHGVVEFETGGSGGSSIRLAEDLAALVDDGVTRRLIPVVGRSAFQNVWDLLLLRGIDMAVLQTDVLDEIQQQRILPGVEGRLSYVAKLNNEEFHLLAGADIKTIADLAHRRVAVGTRDSGTAVTARRLFRTLKLDVEQVNDRPELAIEKLRRGEIAAVAIVAGKPAPLLESLRPDGGLHLVSLPLGPDLVKGYAPTSLSADDYPRLIPKDHQVETVAVGTVLAAAKLAPGSERYRNVGSFVEVFFTQFASLLEPGHNPKWREVNLAAEFPGWQRFPPAQQWLSRNNVARQNEPDLKSMFARFLDTRQQALGGTPMTDQQKQELFGEFQRWQSGVAH